MVFLRTFLNRVAHAFVAVPVVCLFAATPNALYAANNCTGATYYDSVGDTCIACPNGYNYNTDAGKTSVIQCQIHCNAGTFIKTALAPLPDGYTRLLYLESSGTQYISTGYAYANNTTARVVIDSEFLAKQGTAFNGIYPGVAVGGGDINAVFMFLWGTNGRYKHYNVNALLNTRYLFDLDMPNHTYTVSDVNADNAVVVSVDNTNTYDDNWESGPLGDFYLFTYDTASKSRSSQKIYSAKLYDNGVLVRNMVPVRRDADDVLGMYDLVTGTFYTNAGTGTFVAGEITSGSDGNCVNAGAGYWVGANTTNYGSSGTRNACPAGTCSNVTNGTSAAVCQQCAGATYSDTPASTSCFACPTGYDYNLTSGKTNINQCQIYCDVGTYVPGSSSESEYTPLDYLESDGNQYIITNFRHASSNIRGVVRVGVTTDMPDSYNKDILGNLVNGGGGYSVGWAKVFKLWINKDRKRINGPTHPFTAGTIHEFTYELSADTCSISYDNQTVSDTCSFIQGGSSNKISLFFGGDANASLGNAFPGRIYGVKLYEDGTLVHDFVPMKRNSDDELGMYDNVTNTFFTNSGTGEFTGAVHVGCVDAGAGYYSTGGVINYGAAASRIACPAGLTTVGYGHGADEAADCGHKLHVGDFVFYTKQTKPSVPALNILSPEGTVFYLGASPSDHTLSKLHLKHNNQKYTVYDDGLLYGERDFNTGAQITQ